MATTTKRRPAARSRAAAKNKKAAAKRRAKAARPPRFEATREALTEQLDDHRLDAAAIGSAVIGAIIALGVYTSAAGPLGKGLDVAFGAAFGRGRFLIPLACFAVTAALLMRRPDDDEYEVDRHGLRVGLGAFLAIVGITGLWDLSAGSPSSKQGLDAIERAGGVVGALTSRGISALTGTVGASVILGAVVFFGVLLIAGLTLRQVMHGFALGCGFLAAQFRAMFELGRSAMHDEIDLEAQYEDDEPETTKRSRSTRSAAAERAELYDELADSEYFATPDHIDLVEAELVEEEDDEDAEYEEEDDEDELDRVGQPSLDLGPGYKPSEWKLPALTMLKRGSGKQVDERMIDQGGAVLEATLREFGVDARLVGRTIGPTVSRYEIELAPGVKVNKITNLAKEIAYAMASLDVRILAPIPGRSAIGVEVPNKVRPLITLGDILSSDEARSATHPLQVGLGRDIAGQSVMANLATFPHVLIAGQTGAGKSSCINSIVTSILMRATPDQVRLILVDPKRVEMGQYNNVPHLLTEVVVNPKKAANALEWAVREMEMRYDLLAEVGVRDITGYNAMWDRGDLPTAENPDEHGGKNYDRLAFIVIVVDELADLMMVAARDVESSIARIAQMARAVGIHLVIATQRPSVDVITGVIKANVPSRMAFAVSSLTDSRVILDQPGAEKLVGKGDMLMLSASSSRTERLQAAWVDEDCVRKVVAHWRRQVVQPTYDEGVQGEDAQAGGGGFFDDADGDDLLEQAMDLVVRGQLGSTSMLQRKLRVGFARAGRIMDLLENRGVVGPSEGSKPRQVLMTVEELDEIQAR